jgi:hypothetical protein
MAQQEPPDTAPCAQTQPSAADCNPGQLSHFEAQPDSDSPADGADAAAQHGGLGKYHVPVNRQTASPESAMQAVPDLAYQAFRLVATALIGFGFLLYGGKAFFASRIRRADAKATRVARELLRNTQPGTRGGAAAASQAPVKQQQWSASVLRDLAPERYVLLCGSLWETRGYRALPPDHGIDGARLIKLMRQDGRSRVQGIVYCHAADRELGADALDVVISLKQELEVPLVALMTRGHFTPDARTKAMGAMVQLIDGSELLSQLFMLSSDQQDALMGEALGVADSGSEKQGLPQRG